MDPKAIIKAQSRLRVVSNATAELAIYTTHENFIDNWFSFITAANSTYTALEQGAKLNARSRQWFGEKKKYRRRDELLQYIFQARNDDEHGIEPISEQVDGKITLRITVPDTSPHEVNINQIMLGDKWYNPDELSQDKLPELVKHTSPYAKLKAVTGRGGEIFKVPISHLGKSLEAASPFLFATLVLKYLTELVEQAEGFHTPSP